MFQKIKGIITAHKVTTILIVGLALFGGYKAYQSVNGGKTEVRYILAAAQKGTLTTSVSGNGQVSVLQQLEIKSRASGDAVSIEVRQSQTVGAGAVVLQLDSDDAKKSVRDAELNLESAKVALAKLKQPADRLTILQAENAIAQAKRELEALKEPPDALDLLQAKNALAQAKESRQQAEDNLKKAYEDGFNAVANTSLDIPTIMTGLEDLLFSNTFDKQYDNIDWYLNQVFGDGASKANRFSNDVRRSYTLSRASYKTNLDRYQNASRTSDAATLETLITETYEFIKELSETIKITNNYVDFVQDDMERRDVTIPSLINSHQTSLDTYTNDINSHISALLGITRMIQNEKEAIINADRATEEKTESLEKLKKGADESDIKTAEEKIREKEESLKKLKDGPDKLDLQTQKLTVEQRRNALNDAMERLADYSVRAPFPGVIAKIIVKKNDQVSAGSAVATLITKQRIAEISLNEVDAAQVYVGQKAILTFDAIQGLSITGEVAEMDTIGTVSQGVVSYIVKVTFDTQDERVKPSMSVSANIITAAKPDIIMVPSSAVKSQGENWYVEIPESLQQNSGTPTTPVPGGVSLPIPPRQKSIETGISNDEFTEIVSGLNEGDIVVTNTINIQGTAAPTQFQGGFRIPGLQPQTRRS